MGYVTGSNLGPAPSQPAPYNPQPLADWNTQQVNNYLSSIGANTQTASGPAPAATPPVSPLDDPAYANSLNALNLQYGNTALGIAGQDALVEQTYGFDPAFASNPYTKANMLARAAQARYTGTTNSMAAGGQLYSGALNNRRASDAFTSGAADNAARSAYAQAKLDLYNRTLANQSSLALGSADAYTSLIGRMVNSTPDPSVQPAGDGTGGSPSSADLAKAQNILSNPKGKTAAAISWAKQILA